MRILMFLAAAAAATATPSLADEREDAVADIIACTAVRGLKTRAKCYDAALPALQNAYPEAIALAQSRVEAARIAAAENAKDDFGLSPRDAAAVSFEAPAIDDAILSQSDAIDDDQVDAIESVAAEIGKTLRGKILIVLENGQIWRQIDSDSSSPYIPGDGAGLPVQIKKGALGSYSVKVGKARDVFKARRIK